jgi:hypothetical protein
MSLLEIIERLCAVARLQAEIISKQAEELEQAKIADAVAEELRTKRKSAADELALINREYN